MLGLRAALPSADPRAQSKLESGDAAARNPRILSHPEPISIEFHRPLEVVDAEGENPDACFHAPKVALATTSVLNESDMLAIQNVSSGIPPRRTSRDSFSTTRYAPVVLVFEPSAIEAALARACRVYGFESQATPLATARSARWFGAWPLATIAFCAGKRRWMRSNT